VAAVVACDKLVAVVVDFVFGMIVVAYGAVIAADDSSVDDDVLMLDFGWFDVQHDFALLFVECCDVVVVALYEQTYADGHVM